MKRCPQCNRVEADDALVFCRSDGVALVAHAPGAGGGSSRQTAGAGGRGRGQTAGDVHRESSGEAGTAQLGAVDSSEVHTSLLPHNTDSNFNRVTGAAKSEELRAKGEGLRAKGEELRAKGEEVSAKNTRELRRTGRRRIVVPVVVLVLLIGIAVAVYSLAGTFITPAKDKGIESIAVLPFENKSGNADSEYLSDGLSESLIYRLSQLSNLKVSPRSSVFRYKGKEIDAEKIGNELGVDAVMSGRLTQRGDNLTISVDLIDVKNKKTLWGDQFERKMSDLLTREIAAAITDKLQVKLSGTDSSGISKQYTSDNEAYQLYLQGRYFWNKRSSGHLKKATELLRAATEKDPRFALAYAGLADCYAVSYYYVGVRPREIMPLAKTYAAKAIELDPTLAEPHATLGFVSWLLERDKAGAEREFLKAIELNPNYPTAHHWYSRYLRGIGRTQDAFREIKRAEELDPLSLVIINNVAENYVDKDDLNAANRECQRMIDLDPNFWAAHQTLGIVRVKEGRYPEALAEAQKSIQLAERSNASLALLGHVHARLGQRSETEAVIKELERRYANKEADGRDLVVVYAGLDNKDKAFAWLEKAYADRSVFLVFLRLEPLMETLHSDPRWKDLERRVGISES